LSGLWAHQFLHSCQQWPPVDPVGTASVQPVCKPTGPRRPGKPLAELVDAHVAGHVRRGPPAAGPPAPPAGRRFPGRRTAGRSRASTRPAAAAPGFAPASGCRPTGPGGAAQSAAASTNRGLIKHLRRRTGIAARNAHGCRRAARGSKAARCSTVARGLEHLASGPADARSTCPVARDASASQSVCPDNAGETTSCPELSRH
jgi:hypothetical protein